MMTLGETLSRSAIAFPDKEAICFLNDEERRITYAELNGEVDRFADGMVKLGIRANDKVSVWMQNNPEWIVAQYATARIGAVLVPMDTWYKASETEYILKHSNSVAVITSEGFGNIKFLKVLKKIRPALPMLRTIIVVENGRNEDPQSAMGAEVKKGTGGAEVERGAGNTKDFGLDGARSYRSVLELGKDWRFDQDYRDRIFQNELENVVFIIYTSGTTGKPKGAMLSHGNVVANVKDAASIMQIVHNDRILFPVPFSHIFGCVLGIALSVVHGATMVIMEGFAPEDVLKCIEKEKITVCHGVPTMFIRELEILKVKQYDTASLRTGIMAGAPCPVDTMEGVMGIMKCNICIAYGLTECCLITLTRFEDSLAQRVETVGRPLPNVEVKIVNDERVEVPVGEAGELACRGYNVMKGYYDMPEQTSDTIDEEGWLYTGDLAVMNDEGYCSIVGRKKDMVIVGGFNVYPRELEEYLIGNPRVQEVAVVGVPDHDLGEVVAAVIVPKPDIELSGQEVVDLCYGKMASAKVPRFVFIQDSLPISSRGKVQKFLLRKELADRIEKEKLEKLVPSRVTFKKEQGTVEELIDRMVATGKFLPEQRSDLQEFVLSLDEEQDDKFRGLVFKRKL